MGNPGHKLCVHPNENFGRIEVWSAVVQERDSNDRCSATTTEASERKEGLKHIHDTATRQMRLESVWRQAGVASAVLRLCCANRAMSIQTRVFRNHSTRGVCLRKPKDSAALFRRQRLVIGVPQDLRTASMIKRARRSVRVGLRCFDCCLPPPPPLCCGRKSEDGG